MAFAKILLFFSFGAIINLNAKVHVIGDSHAVSCFCNQGHWEGIWQISKDGININVPYIVHWLGPVTMHRIGRDGLDILDIRKFNVQEGDTVVFVFGEIDARCHIGKQRDVKGRRLNDIIQNLIINYLLTIQKNMKLYSNVSTLVFNIIPPIDNCYNEEFPYYGPLSDRVAITRECNDTLKGLCPFFGIKFLDTYDYYALSDGSLNPFFTDDIHIRVTNNGFIKENLAKLINLDFYSSFVE